MKLLQRLKNLFLPEGKISDGFHSFDELYHYRMLGWKCSYAGKATLGQDAYYCIICTKPDKDFKYKIFGNAYEGSISKEKL